MGVRLLGGGFVEGWVWSFLGNGCLCWDGVMELVVERKCLLECFLVGLGFMGGLLGVSVY